MKELLQRAIQINEELVAKLKELEEPNLLGTNGKYFTAKIEDIKCKGRVIVEGGEVYLCQDEVDGLEYKEKYGYKYSYFIRKGTEDDLEGEDVKDLKLWDYLPKEGEYFYVKTAAGYEYIAIAKNGEYLTSRFVSISQDYKELNYNESWFVCPEPNIKELRSATTEEITLLDTKLKENGKYFDKESMSIKEIEPLFKEGDYLTTTTKEGKRWIGIFDRYEREAIIYKVLLKPKTILYYDVHLTFGKPRLATQPEINILDAKLKENGKYFDKEIMSILKKKKNPVKPTFKVGDWVIPKKPKDVRQNPAWTPLMDEYDGQTLEIEEINFEGYLGIDGWNFNPNWCTKVEAPKLKVGDLCIFWNYKKSDAVIGKLTGIDNIPDFPYEVANVSSYKNCFKFESMEQYNKFIEE